MITQLPLSEKSIIDCLSSYYGINITKLTFLPIGADVNASVYKADTQDKHSYFIKIKRGHHHDISIDIVQLLIDGGIQQIILPIKTIEGQPTQYISDFTIIVYPFIDGQDGFCRNLTDDQWITLGKALRQVHEMNLPPAIQSELRQEAFSPKWREAVLGLYKHIESAPSGDEMAMQLLEFMKQNTKIIHHMVKRSDELAQSIQKQTLSFVLCHSDIHGGNVLIDKDENLYIVDWDEPIIAPKERDLMYIGGGVGNVWNKPHEEALFYKGYGKSKVNIKILAYYRFERIVEDLALYGHDLLLTDTGGEDRTVFYKMVIDMFEPNGVVDIAFKTDALL